MKRVCYASAMCFILCTATQDKIINMLSGDGQSRPGGLDQITSEGNFTVYDVVNFP